MSLLEKAQKILDAASGSKPRPIRPRSAVGRGTPTWLTCGSWTPTATSSSRRTTCREVRPRAMRTRCSTSRPTTRAGLGRRGRPPHRGGRVRLRHRGRLPPSSAGRPPGRAALLRHALGRLGRPDAHGRHKPPTTSSCRCCTRRSSVVPEPAPLDVVVAQCQASQRLADRARAGLGTAASTASPSCPTAPEARRGDPPWAGAPEIVGVQCRPNPAVMTVHGPGLRPDLAGRLRARPARGLHPLMSADLPGAVQGLRLHRMKTSEIPVQGTRTSTSTTSSSAR